MNKPAKVSVIFSSDLHLGDNVVSTEINLGLNQIKLLVQENEFAILDWLLSVSGSETQEEAITLMISDKEKTCQLVLTGLSVDDHKCVLSAATGNFGIDAPEDLYHEITIHFKLAERIKNFKL